VNSRALLEARALCDVGHVTSKRTLKGAATKNKSKSFDLAAAGFSLRKGGRLERLAQEKS
jgi:hypothetical protein